MPLVHQPCSCWQQATAVGIFEIFLLFSHWSDDMSTSSLLSITWLKELPGHCPCHAQTDCKFSVQGIQSMDEVLELLCMHFIIDTDSLCFWTLKRSLPPTYWRPSWAARLFCFSFLQLFYYNFCATRHNEWHFISVFSCTAQGMQQAYKTTYQMTPPLWIHTILCVTKPGLQRLGVNQGNAAINCPFPDLYVHVTKATKLQLQQVLPLLCKCSLFLKESKGAGLYSSQHNHHLLLLLLLVACSIANWPSMLPQWMPSGLFDCRTSVNPAKAAWTWTAGPKTP